MPTVSFITAEDFLLDQEINGIIISYFCFNYNLTFLFFIVLRDENDTFKNINIEMAHDGIFMLQKFKSVYNNIFELKMHCEFLNYQTNAENVKQDHENNILIIPNIQKLENNLEIALTIKGGETKKITVPTYKFSSFFKDI